MAMADSSLPRACICALRLEGDSSSELEEPELDDWRDSRDEAPLPIIAGCTMRR
jgi:hypothetical protein